MQNTHWNNSETKKKKTFENTNKLKFDHEIKSFRIRKLEMESTFESFSFSFDVAIAIAISVCWWGKIVSDFIKPLYHLIYAFPFQQLCGQFGFFFAYLFSHWLFHLLCVCLIHLVKNGIGSTKPKNWNH